MDSWWEAAGLEHPLKRKPKPIHCNYLDIIQDGSYTFLVATRGNDDEITNKGCKIDSDIDEDFRVNKDEGKYPGMDDEFDKLIKIGYNPITVTVMAASGVEAKQKLEQTVIDLFEEQKALMEFRELRV